MNEYAIEPFDREVKDERKTPSMMLDGASSREESHAVLYERDQAAEESQPNIYGQVNDIHIKKQGINY